MKTVAEDKAIKVGIQGYEGSFHHIAAESFYNRPLELAPMNTFNALISALRKNKTDEAVMAIENSIAGSILTNYNLLSKSSLFIKGEIYLQIAQNLLTLPGVKIEELTEVHSHPMAILQCEKFFSQHPDIKLIESEDTALSALMVQQKQQRNIGAIASTKAAEIYKLQVLEKNIETVKNNFTRFLILSNEAHIESADNNKASLNFKLANIPGALSRALQIVFENNVNISKIQSSPVVATEWQYYFHLDIEFDSTVQFNNTVQALQDVTEELKVLGVYKRGKTIC